MGGEERASGALAAAPEVLFAAPLRGPGRRIPVAAGGRRDALEEAPRRSARLDGDPSPAHLGTHDCG